MDAEVFGESGDRMFPTLFKITNCSKDDKFHVAIKQITDAPIPILPTLSKNRSVSPDRNEDRLLKIQRRKTSTDSDS